MLTDRTVYLNGKLVEWEKATVHIMSHSLARGSAIFEVMSFHETDRGSAVFRLDEHIRRLFKTARLLSMELPLSEAGFREAVLRTVRANNLSHGMIKLVCYVHEVAFQILPRQRTLDVSIVVVDPGLDLEEDAIPPLTGVSACICRWRKLHPETVPVEAKVAANYINGMVARQEARRRGFDMGILLDTEGFVAEGALESVFFAQDGILTTPPLATILEGITRKSLLEAARFFGLKAAEQRVKPETLMKADEVFFSCSPVKILPVKRIESRIIPEVPGPIEKNLMAGFDEICSGKIRRFKKWLSPVA